MGDLFGTNLLFLDPRPDGDWLGSSSGAEILACIRTEVISL